MIVTGYGNEPGREKSVADMPASSAELVPVAEGLAASFEVEVEEVPGPFSDCRRVFLDSEGRVQMRTRKRVSDHVQRKFAASLVEPPLRSTGTSPESVLLTRPVDFRKMERS